MTLKVHFDGKVFVPDEPVNLRPGAVAKVVIECDQPASPETAQQASDATKPLPSLTDPLIVGLDPELARAIGEDPEFDIENS